VVSGLRVSVRAALTWLGTKYYERTLLNFFLLSLKK
jgi:hypothetical protein